ncbi:hypothetical protein ABZ916_31920 [Streptomyces sp. NPDC046853]|uniref:hypothetical protein n=1 Tax=Streptomyces sp. NPDC046853 TaxID=3154920 RepID=UPI0033D7D7D2
MSSPTATLYGIAGALEVIGLIVTIVDIAAARRRIGKFLTRTRHVFGQETVRGRDSFTPPARTSEAESLDERVKTLEQWAQSVPQQMAMWDDRITSYLSRDYRNEIDAAQKTIGDQLDGLREYVEGSKQRTWDSYRGPILLVLGVLVTPDHASVGVEGRYALEPQRAGAGGAS